MLRPLLLLVFFLCAPAIFQGADNLESLIFETKLLEPYEGDFAEKNSALEFKYNEKTGMFVSHNAGKFFDMPANFAGASSAGNCIFGYFVSLDAGKNAGDEKFDDFAEKTVNIFRKKINDIAGGKLEETKSLKIENYRQTTWYQSGKQYTLLLAESVQKNEKKEDIKARMIFFSVRPSVEQLVFSPELFKISADELDKSVFSDFRWTSDAKDSARSPAPGILFGIQAPEAILRFKDGKVSSATISLYNRGDAGAGNEPTEKEFNAMVEKAQNAINARLDVKGTFRSAFSGGTINVARNDSMLWKTPTAQYLLEWNKTSAGRSADKRRHAEFLRLTVMSADKDAAPKANVWKAADHLKTDAAGDRYIFDVPMVDQGQKGYCAAAVGERVLRYYGMTVDQHEIAKLAGTSADKGTNLEEMYVALRRISSKLKLRTRVLMESDERFLKNLIGDYNKAAKKVKKSEIQPSPEWSGQIDKTIFKEVRLKDKSGMNRFEKNIVTCIDQGKPLIWCVHIGLVPEPMILPQMSGGHMRLIIGYNDKTKEVIYTDTWGAGHEMKKVKLEDAWTMTFGQAVMEM